MDKWESGASPPDTTGSDLIHLAAGLTRDLLDLCPLVYWTDLAASAATGYGAAALAVLSRPVPIKAAAALVAILALYRALSFIHELTHLKPRALPGFRIVWNLVIGVPLLVPSFMYEGVHTLHHARTRYGTPQDPEYLPLARMRPWTVPLFVFVSLLAPLGLLLRFAVLAPLSLVIRPLRKTVVERFSALSISPTFCRDPPQGRDWLVWEASASLWALTLIGGVASGFIPFAAGVMFLVAGSGVAFLNQCRTLVAHLWENDGEPIAITAQYLDSVNVPAGWLPALWAPVGLRYHALHHLLPGIPYHCLGRAHRRLARALPPQSPFHAADHKGLALLTLRLLRATARKRGPRGG